jgi:hypothetical protein
VADAVPFPDPAELFRRLPLRPNVFAAVAAEAPFAGLLLGRRLRLTADVSPGRYLYVVDAAGLLWVGPPFDPDGTTFKHSSLLPAFEPARAAGRIAVATDRRAGANTDSGHFMAEAAMTRADELLWGEAMRSAFALAGLTPADVRPGPGLIRVRT